MPRRLHYHSRPVFVFQPNFNVEDVFSTINSDQFRMYETYQSFDEKVKMDKDSKDSIFQHLQLALDLVTRWKKKHIDFLCRLQNPGLRVVSSTIQAKSKPEIIEIWSIFPHHHMPQLSHFISSKFDSKCIKMWHLVWLNFGLQIQPARFLSTLCVQATRRAWQLKYSVASTICSSHASLSVAPTMAVLHSPRHPESHDHWEVMILQSPTQKWTTLVWHRSSRTLWYW